MDFEEVPPPPPQPIKSIALAAGVTIPYKSIIERLWFKR